VKPEASQAKVAHLPWALLAGMVACSSPPDNPVRQALAARLRTAAPITAVAFRFAGERGGDTRLYVLPQLTEATWRFRTPDLAVERVVGFSREEDEIYLQTSRQELASLDLATGRARVVDTAVAAAALGPTGIVYLVHRNGSLASIEYRAVKPWPEKLEGQLERLWGAGSERLIAVVRVGSERRLISLVTGKPAVSQPLPQGPVAVTAWGDLAAVGADSGLVLLDPSDPARRTFRPLDRPVQAIAFSPSGHRLYLVSRERLLALDRSSLDVVHRSRLPGPAAAIRSDPLGRILLLKPAQGDSIWLWDPVEQHLMGTLPGTWREDLPAVAPDGSVLVARGPEVVAHAPDSLTVRRVVAAGARDRWLAAAWDPRRPSLQLVADSAETGEPAAPSGLEIYVQVSSTANEAWAQDLARSLRAAGLKATVLAPSGEEDRYRVVLGPYPTREAAEATGRKLGRPFWIFTREGQDPQR